MGMTAYFDVEYTDAALDKAIREAQASGGAAPKRTLMSHPSALHFTDISRSQESSHQLQALR
jgi:hypothetical protein